MIDDFSSKREYAMRTASRLRTTDHLLSSSFILHPSSFILLLPCLLLSGCGSDLPERIRVDGTVTFNGGPPPAAGELTFWPIETAEGLPSRPASATFGADGKFNVDSFGSGDGLVPGRYRVNVMCWRRQPNPMVPGDVEAANYVPADYRAPELVIETGTRGRVEVSYDVPLIEE